MRRLLLSHLAILALVQFILCITPLKSSLAQEWEFRKSRGTLKVVDLFLPSVSAMLNYAEGLMTLDEDGNWAPCLAKDWRWIDEQTIEFKLREDVRFHNGEKFNAQAVAVNWEAYRAMETPRPHRLLVPSDDTELQIIDDYTVRFVFPEPDGMAFVKLRWFFQFAPAFFAQYKFEEGNYGYMPKADPWGTGPFKFVERTLIYAKPSDQLVLEANEDYWDPRYLKVRRVAIDNTLLGESEEAMRLCRESEGHVDIVNRIRPLDTLKVAESHHAKIVKSKDVAVIEGVFNQRKGDSKWRDMRLRKAINYAIKREELWKYCARGNAHNLGGYIPPQGYGHNEKFTLFPYETDKARSLLAEVGYPKGFDVKVIAMEQLKLEAQVISKMFERIGLKTRFEVYPMQEFYRKVYIPRLETPPEEQDWDVALYSVHDWYGNTGSDFLTWGLLDGSDWRWIEYDPVYEEMWRNMARTVDKVAQEEKIQEIEEYIYNRAYLLFIYSPLSLYAVNKEVDFVPQKYGLLCLKETSVTDSHWSVRDQE